MLKKQKLKLLINIFFLLVLLTTQVGIQPVHATELASGASRDIILIIDTSINMAFETSGLSHVPDHPNDDPSVCNLNNTCQPMKAVKDAALDFIDLLNFSHDRVSVIASTSQMAGGTRDHVTVLSLSDDETDVRNAINSLKVFQPPVCNFGSPASPATGPCINYVSSVFTGFDCPLYRFGPDLMPSTGDEVNDISSCNTSNIGGVLSRSASEFVMNSAVESSKIVIQIASNPANATDSASGFPYGFCPSYTWNSITHPFCRDADAETRHNSSSTDYDADDYARDMADYLVSSVDGVKVYTIGLGNLIRNASKGDPDSGEQLLEYIADEAAYGQYFYAPNASSLVSILQIITNNISCEAVVTNINDSGDGSLRKAISDACHGGTITFDSSLSGQTIRLQSTLTIDKNLTIDASTLSEKIILNGDSDNDGDGDIKLISIASNKIGTIKNIKFTKGFSPSYTLNAGGIDNLGILNVYDSEFDFNAGGQGGAIRNSGDLYVEDSTFTNNSALEGGAILNNLNAETEIRTSAFSNNSTSGQNATAGAVANIGSIVIYDSEFTNNSAFAGGGAFVNAIGTATILNSTFTGNSTQGIGGAIVEASGTTSISSSVFMNNSALQDGGAINNLNGNVVINQTTFSNNIAKSGGAISAGNNSSGQETNTTTTISESTISNNQASLGSGGIEFYSGINMVIDKTTISGNTALAGGGVVNISGNLLTITNSTIANNTVTQLIQNNASGILSLVSPINGRNSPLTIKNSTVTGNNYSAITVYGDVIISNTTIAGNPGYGLEVYNDSLTIRNSILANNYGDCRVQNGTVTANENNLIETNSGCGTPASTADPLLGPLADNGGLTQTMALLQNSPAIEAGNNATCETTDQRGITRPQGNNCDMGAYEYQLFPSVESISRVNSSPTSSATVNFTVVFSEDVTGLDTSDFTLTTTGIINSSITNISGENTTYVVSVNTGSGDGTIRLDFIDDDTVINQFSNSPNADFTTGEVYVIDKPNLSAPRLRSPRNNMTTNDSTPTLWWSNVNGAQSYEIQLSTNSDFSSGVISEISNSISHTLITSLTDGTYFWRVRVYNSGKWSTSRTIIIDTTAPAIPILISPNDAITLSSSYTFRWSPSATAVQYEFQYDNDADFSSPRTITVRGTSRRLPTLPDDVYYCRVRAKDAAGNWSNWSVIRTFTMQ